MVYYTKVEPDVLFRYGDFLGGKTNQAVLDELFTDNDQILSEKLNVKYAQKINRLLNCSCLIFVFILMSD
jgi:hypothetical protein